MHQFSVLPTAFKDLKTRIVQVILFILSLMVVVIVVIPWIASGELPVVDSSMMLTLLLMVLILVFTFVRALKRQKAMLASYILTITDDSISREMMNTPAIVIHRNDIREIVKRPDGTIGIIGDSKLNAIGISAHIARKEELESLLNSIKPMTIKTAAWYQPYLFFIITIPTVLMFLAFYLEDKILSSVAGVLFAGAMIYCMVVIQKSKNVDNRTKRLSYAILIPLLSVIGTLIMKWMA